MGMQPSASKTGLLLLCPRPFDPALESEPDISGEPARYGSAFHQILAACLHADMVGKTVGKKPLERTDRYTRAVDAAAAKYEVKGTVHELAGHVKSSVQVLRNWLTREKLIVTSVERSYAITPQADGTWGHRPIPPHDEDHHYELETGDIGATVDLIASDAKKTRTVVIDHKTGGEDTGFAQPTTMPQMRTLGLIASDAAAEVGIFHADRRGLPIVYAEPYAPVEQDLHAGALYTALSRIGQGFLRPGPHCGRCPAKVTCPAWAADLLAESTAALVSSATTLALEPIDPKALLALPADAPEGMATLEARAGALYELLKRFSPLEKAASDEIKRLVRGGAVIETREGKVLAIQTQSYETLSKKSVIEALGKVAGEKELKRLREKGAMHETTREMLKGE